jgi:hypothetical protein
VVITIIVPVTSCTTVDSSSGRNDAARRCMAHKRHNNAHFGVHVLRAFASNSTVTPPLSLRSGTQA